VSLADAAGSGAGIGAAPVGRALWGIRAETFGVACSFDGAMLGATAQTSFASARAAATGSVAELLSRKAPPATAIRIPAAMHERAGSESFRSAARRNGGGVASGVPSAKAAGGWPFAISEWARAGPALVAAAFAAADPCVRPRLAVERVPASSSS
jgi:hypothetical protein